MHGWTDGPTDGGRERGTIRWAAGRTDRRTDEQTDGQRSKKVIFVVKLSFVLQLQQQTVIVGKT